MRYTHSDWADEDISTLEEMILKVSYSLASQTTAFATQEYPLLVMIPTHKYKKVYDGADEMCILVSPRGDQAEKKLLSSLAYS